MASEGNRVHRDESGPAGFHDRNRVYPLAPTDGINYLPDAAATADFPGSFQRSVGHRFLERRPTSEAYQIRPFGAELSRRTVIWL